MALRKLVTIHKSLKVEAVADVMNALAESLGLGNVTFETTNDGIVLKADSWNSKVKY